MIDTTVMTATMPSASRIRNLRSSAPLVLEVADGLHVLDQLRHLAEVGVRTRGIHEGADLALADDRAGEHRVARPRILAGLPGGVIDVHGR